MAKTLTPNATTFLKYTRTHCYLCHYSCRPAPAEWGSALARERVLDYLERLENTVMLRAVQNARSAITTVVPVEDPYFAVEWTNNLQPEIMKMIASCPPTFD